MQLKKSFFLAMNSNLEKHQIEKGCQVKEKISSSYENMCPTQMEKGNSSYEIEQVTP